MPEIRPVISNILFSIRLNLLIHQERGRETERGRQTERQRDTEPERQREADRDWDSERCIVSVLFSHFGNVHLYFSGQ